MTSHDVMHNAWIVYTNLYVPTPNACYIILKDMMWYLFTTTGFPPGGSGR